MSTTNWRGLQAFGCLKHGFDEPRGIIPGNLSGGAWRANLHKEGTKHKPSHGGSPKPKKKVKLKYHTLLIDMKLDKKGYVIS